MASQYKRWKNQSQSKSRLQFVSRQEEELKECTFQPVTNNGRVTDSDLSTGAIPGMNWHMERMKRAAERRKAQESASRLLRPIVATPLPPPKGNAALLEKQAADYGAIMDSHEADSRSRGQTGPGMDVVAALQALQPSGGSATSPHRGGQGGGSTISPHTLVSPSTSTSIAVTAAGGGTPSPDRGGEGGFGRVALRSPSSHHQRSEEDNASLRRPPAEYTSDQHRRERLKELEENISSNRMRWEQERHELMHSLEEHRQRSSEHYTPAVEAPGVDSFRGCSTRGSANGNAGEGGTRGGTSSQWAPLPKVQSLEQEVLEHAEMLRMLTRLQQLRAAKDEGAADSVDRLQAGMQALRAQLSEKDEDIERLRSTVAEQGSELNKCKAALSGLTQLCAALRQAVLDVSAEQEQSRSQPRIHTTYRDETHTSDATRIAIGVPEDMESDSPRHRASDLSGRSAETAEHAGWLGKNTWVGSHGTPRAPPRVYVPPAPASSVGTVHLTHPVVQVDSMASASLGTDETIGTSTVEGVAVSSGASSVGRVVQAVSPESGITDECVAASSPPLPGHGTPPQAAPEAAQLNEQHTTSTTSSLSSHSPSTSASGTRSGSSSATHTGMGEAAAASTATATALQQGDECLGGVRSGWTLVAQAAGPVPASVPADVQQAAVLAAQWRAAWCVLNESVFRVFNRGALRGWLPLSKCQVTVTVLPPLPPLESDVAPPSNPYSRPVSRRGSIAAGRPSRRDSVLRCSKPAASLPPQTPLADALGGVLAAAWAGAGGASSSPGAPQSEDCDVWTTLTCGPNVLHVQAESDVHTLAWTARLVKAIAAAVVEGGEGGGSPGLPLAEALAVSSTQADAEDSVHDTAAHPLRVAYECLTGRHDVTGGVLEAIEGGVQQDLGSVEGILWKLAVPKYKQAALASAAAAAAAGDTSALAAAQEALRWQRRLFRLDHSKSRIGYHDTATLALIPVSGRLNCTPLAPLTGDGGGGAAASARSDMLALLPLQGRATDAPEGAVFPWQLHHQGGVAPSGGAGAAAVSSVALVNDSLPGGVAPGKRRQSSASTGSATLLCAVDCKDTRTGWLAALKLLCSGTAAVHSSFSDSESD